jgi:hypothetical protein
MKSSIYYYLFHASHDNGIDELAELHPAADACGCHVPAAALFTAECHVHRHPPHTVGSTTILSLLQRLALFFTPPFQQISSHFTSPGPGYSD